MTAERWVLLLFGCLNAAAGVVAAGAAQVGLPLWAGLVAAAVVAGSGAVLTFMRSWSDTAPAQPHG